MVERVMLMVECVFVLCTTFALVIKTNSIMKEIHCIVFITIEQPKLIRNIRV